MSTYVVLGNMVDGRRLLYFLNDFGKNEHNHLNRNLPEAINLCFFHMVTIKQHKTSEERMEIIEMSQRSQSFKFLKRLDYQSMWFK